MEIFFCCFEGQFLITVSSYRASLQSEICDKRSGKKFKKMWKRRKTGEGKSEKGYTER